ncbi:MAG: sigma-70 family RNA polymerase sigma factor [Planctomycetaceae bacterium]
MLVPETRPSLILRVRDPNDADAWNQFATLYRPVILRLARRKGIQVADAEDLAQQVLFSVAGAIERWQPDPQRARFRTWLQTIVRNAILNAMQRQSPDQATGGDSDADRFEIEQSTRTDEEALQNEYRRELFQQAAQQIRAEYAEETWDSFWKTAVQGIDIETLCSQTGRTRGSIYASRSRVMKRMREVIEHLEEQLGDR